MKSKLEALFDDKDFGTGAIGHDNGIMIHSEVPVDYLILEYGNRFDVYLNKKSTFLILCDGHLTEMRIFNQNLV